MAKEERRIISIGIDSSTTCTGIGVVSIEGKKENIVNYTKILLNKNLTYEEKCVTVYDAVKSIYLNYKDTDDVVVSIELLNSMKNMDTTRKLAGLWGYIIITFFKEFGIHVNSINTMTVKKIATGNGSADKQKVIKYINKYFKLNLKYNNKKELSDDDVADAICVALANIRLSKAKEKNVKK